MLDFVLNLLIFFIITTSFVQGGGRHRHAARGRRPRSHARAGNILIAIRENGEIWMDRRQVDLREVRPLIERLHVERPDDTVVIIADKAAQAGVVAQVMDEVKRVAEAIDGHDAAYYLVHSMGGAADFAEPDRAAAAAFRDAADRTPARADRVPRRAGRRRRRAVAPPAQPPRGRPGPRRRPVPVTELRAAVIIGSGSAPASRCCATSSRCCR